MAAPHLQDEPLPANEVGVQRRRIQREKLLLEDFQDERVQLRHAGFRQPDETDTHPMRERKHALNTAWHAVPDDVTLRVAKSLTDVDQVQRQPGK